MAARIRRQTSPAGFFAGEIGTMRLLDLFGRWGIKTSWFVPGHSMETFPEQMKRVAAAGHEFGVHGYSHENPIALTSDQEETILVKCIGLIEQLTGRKPRGYAAPWWELSPAPLRQRNGRCRAHGRLHLLHRARRPH